MAKESGIGMSVTIDDHSGAAKDVSNDITQISFNTPRGAQDITGLDKSGMERLLLLADGQVSITWVFNDAADHIFAVLKTAPSYTGTRTVVIVVSGQTLTMEMVLTDVQFQRNQDGSFGGTAQLQLANGAIPAWT